MPTNVSILDAFGQVTDWLSKADHCSAELSALIDKFPMGGNGIKSTDPELLVLKATSQATLASLEECLYALQLQQRQVSSSQKKFGSTSSVK